MCQVTVTGVSEVGVHEEFDATLTTVVYPGPESYSRVSSDTRWGGSGGQNGTKETEGSDRIFDEG